jgi:DNA-damage-inducible protein J
MANVNIRVDDSLKKKTETILNNLGLNLSVATNVFYRQVVQRHGLPFEVRLDEDKEQQRAVNTIIAKLEESERDLADGVAPLDGEEFFSKLRKKYGYRAV